MAKGILPKDAAVLYLRMSSTKQDKSIPAQRDELLAYATRQGYRVIREYVDSAISGDETGKRTGFLRMRDDVVQGEFSVVLCWDQDRFGRFDPIEGGYWILPFRDAGVRLETIAQGKIDWTDFAGRLLYVVQQEAKHAYLRDLSRNVTRGVLAATKNGRSGTGGRCPDGYMLNDGQVVLDPDRASIIRRIFEEYVTVGASLRSVADLLNRGGFRTPRGKLWRQTTVRLVLTNAKYAGDFVRFRYHVGKYHAVQDGEIVARSKGDGHTLSAPEIVIPNNHEPIVPKPLFDRVQRKLAIQQKHTAHRTGHRYVFTGLIRCGDCHRIMRGHTAPGPKYSYTCRTYHDSGTSACYSNCISETPLRDCVVRMIQKQYLSDEAIGRLRKALEKRLETEPRQDGEVDVKPIRKRIEDLDRQIDQGAERIFSAPEGLVPKLYAKLDQLRAERDELQRRVNGAERQQNGSATDRTQEIEAAIDALRSLRDTFAEADPEHVQELLASLVARIELHFQHKTVGKRTRSTFRHGTIFVRPDPALSSLMYTSADDFGR